MRFVTYLVSGSNEPRVGLLQGDGVVPLRYGSMLDLIRASNPQTSPGGDVVPLERLTLQAPIPVPHANLICLGRNYAEHAGEMARSGRDPQSRPTFFAKGPNTVIGPTADIPAHEDLTSELDWEVELGVILGRRLHRVSEADALNYVFGYTVLNDISARDLQYGYGGQFYYGKSLDGSCPMGPSVVTTDEMADPQNLHIFCTVNGEQKQEASTADMIYSVAETIALLSRGMTLEPGQIIATGTPSGVGNARNPKETLKPGDEVVSGVREIGTLRNRVMASNA